MNSQYKKIVALVVFCCVLWFLPAPEGLKPQTWHIFALYVTAILGLILRPLPDAIIMMTMVCLMALLINVPSALSGFSSSSTWLVFSAFMIGNAFIKTGLGARVSYHLINRAGRSSLGLAYAQVLADLVIAPATPSNTARSAGIVFPIFNSTAAALGSRAEDGTSGKIAGYLELVSFQTSLSTAGIFMTATSPNPALAALALSVLGIEISWLGWAKGAIVPGLLALSLLPLILYKIYPPEITKIRNNKELAREGLARLGPMSRNEKLLALFFVLAILTWATGEWTKIDATAIALVFFVVLVLSNVLSWDNIISSKAAFSTFFWFGGILSLAGALAKGGFFVWLGNFVEKTISFGGLPWVVTMGIMLVISILIRYCFASVTAYATSMVPVFWVIGKAAGIPLMPLALLFAYTASIGGITTHYGGAVAPAIFQFGHVSTRDWWRCGIPVAYLTAAIYMGVGLLYWKGLGLY